MARQSGEMPEKDQQKPFMEITAKIYALAVEIEERQIIESDRFQRTNGWSHPDRFPLY
ncbi:MAG TPA: hypothetical protein VLA17_02500 [Candidatus Limnocylindria bacterium]|nr:hypothetical protein [Candidatus Limnocylindria bacterium]